MKIITTVLRGLAKPSGSECDPLPHPPRPSIAPNVFNLSATLFCTVVFTMILLYWPYIRRADGFFYGRTCFGTCGPMWTGHYRKCSSAPCARVALWLTIRLFRPDPSYVCWSLWTTLWACRWLLYRSSDAFRTFPLFYFRFFIFHLQLFFASF